MVDGKKISHRKTLEYFNKAMMCRLMKCRPSELRHEDPDDLEMLSYIFMKMSEKNPMMMFS